MEEFTIRQRGILLRQGVAAQASHTCASRRETPCQSCADVAEGASLLRFFRLYNRWSRWGVK